MSNGLCLRYYFSSHKTRDTSQWNAGKHFDPFSDFYFHGGECWGVKGMSLHMCLYMYLPTCVCRYWHSSKLICLFLTAVVSFVNLGCHNTAKCWCKEKCRFRWVLSLTVHNSAIVFMNFCLVFRLLGNLVCNPTGYKLEVIFNLPEKIGDSWRCLWSDVLSKDRPGLLTIANSLGFIWF